jgi:hypothetical protein
MNEGEQLSDTEEILRVSIGFRHQIKFADESWANENMALNLFESQVEICKTTKDLIKENRFDEAFILNRTVFENYFLIALILKGTKYVLKYKISTEPGESFKQAYEKLAARLAKQQTEGRKDIISFRPLKKYKQIEIIHQGLFSKEGDRLFPIYHFVFEEYDPIKHRVYKFPSIASKELFTDHVAEWQKRHEALYKTYFGFETILKACVLNGLISEEQRIRAKVHYNFLSSFTHLTNLGFNLTHSYDYGRNKHYLIELNLLYTIHLLRLHVLLLLDFFSKTKHRVENSDERQLYLNHIGKKYAYFWFIFNEPTEYDFCNYQTVKAMRQREGKPIDETIPYYKDPYIRLMGQHKTTCELSTGQIYRSPWEPHP